MRRSPLLYQQSSTDIWRAVASAVKEAVAGAVKATPSSTPASIKNAIRAIAFDATCSLVVLGEDDQPITVSPDGQDGEENIILWLDHRAVKQANFINGTNHPVLKYVGGKVSPEMEVRAAMTALALTSCQGRVLLLIARHRRCCPDAQAEVDQGGAPLHLGSSASGL